MMPAIDPIDLAIYQDDAELRRLQKCWLSTPPAIVQVFDPSIDEGGMAGYSTAHYHRFFEITVEEAERGVVTDRYVLENGATRRCGDPGKVQKGTHDATISLPARLERIKTAFGFGMTHLAAAMGVERPTVYAWMKGERHPQSKRWERVSALSNLADYWEGISRKSLGRLVFVPVVDGKSVLDLLSAETLDDAGIREALVKLSDEKNARAERLRGKAEALRERMKAKGGKPLPDELVDQTLRDLGA